VEQPPHGNGSTRYLFIGHNSIAANAVFSSLELARSWVASYCLTGTIFLHMLNEPAFDRLVPDGQVGPRPMPPYFGTGRVAPAEFVDINAAYRAKHGYLDDEPAYRDESLLAWQGRTPTAMKVSRARSWSIGPIDSIPDLSDVSALEYAFVVRGMPLAVFSSRAVASEWIRKHQLTGRLHWHRLNFPAFDYDLHHGCILPRNPLRNFLKAGGSCDGYREYYYSPSDFVVFDEGDASDEY
jgi:hypothetical protein